MSLGFVVRDLVRRRIPVTVHLVTGRALSGTIDRAGADHLDLALHEIGAVRRADQVRGFRIVPFAAVAAMRELGPDQCLRIATAVGRDWERIDERAATVA